MLELGHKKLFVDLGASSLLSAAKEERAIAVEIKSFRGKSDVKDLQQAIGQYVMYKHLLTYLGKQRELFLAVTKDVYNDVFKLELVQLMIKMVSLRLVIFDPESKEIIEWTP